MSAEEGASCPPSSCLGGREGRAGCQGHVLQGLRGAPSSHRPLDLPSPASGPWRGSPHLWLLGNKILGVSDLEAPRARASPPHPGGGHGFPTRPGRTRLTMATVSRLPMVRTARDTRSSGWVSTFSETARSAPQAGQHLCGTTGRQPAPAPDGRGSPPWEAVSRRAGGGGRGGGLLVELRRGVGSAQRLSWRRGAPVGTAHQGGSRRQRGPSTAHHPWSPSRCSAQGLPLTKNWSAKHRPSTSPSTQATSPKDAPRAAVLGRRGRPELWGPSPGPSLPEPQVPGARAPPAPSNCRPVPSQGPCAIGPAAPRTAHRPGRNSVSLTPPS